MIRGENVFPSASSSFYLFFFNFIFILFSRSFYRFPVSFFIFIFLFLTNSHFDRCDNPHCQGTSVHERKHKWMSKSVCSSIHKQHIWTKLFVLNRWITLECWRSFLLLLSVVCWLILLFFFLPSYRFEYLDYSIEFSMITWSAFLFV